MSLEEIQSLDCGSWFGENWSDERIPELKDVLKSVPKEKEIYIEVKTKYTDFVFENYDENLNIKNGFEKIWKRIAEFTLIRYIL